MRYVITGGSGYIGTRLVERLGALEKTEQIVIADVRPPRTFRPKTHFKRLDVRDREGARTLLREIQPDVLVHLAFVLNPIHDEQLMYEVDVNGTHKMLEAATEAGTQQVLVTSSGVAYGAFPDNPEPLTEDDPVRGLASFSYARDKTESDRICQLWGLRHPDRVMTIVRPCIVLGPSVDNYLVRLWSEQPFQPDVGNLDDHIQFVHEDDVVDALTGLLAGRHEGAFNLSGDGLMTRRECAELIEAPIRRMPLALYKALVKVMWTLRQSEAPPGSIPFALYPWIVSNAKLKSTLGWTPRHSSRETFEIAMRARGRLEPSAGDGSSADGAAEPAKHAAPAAPGAA